MAVWTKVKDLDDNKFPDPKPTRQYKEPIGPSKPSLKERLLGNPVVKKTKEWMEAHPANRREKPERHDRSEPRERSEPRRKMSRIDRYEDGKIKETVYFGTDERIPTRKAPRRQRRAPNQLGSVGAGMNMSDFIPSNMGLGSAMGLPKNYNPYNPYAPAQQPSRRKKKRRTSYAQEPEGSWMDPGYIPPSLRDFF